jgi:hypothetical protein
MEWILSIYIVVNGFAAQKAQEHLVVVL